MSEDSPRLYSEQELLHVFREVGVIAEMVLLVPFLSGTGAREFFLFTTPPPAPSGD